MSNNKLVVLDILKDMKQCLPNFYAVEKNGSYLVYKCNSHMMLDHPVNVIYLEKEALIESVVSLHKNALDKITRITLARSGDTNIYSIHRWIYKLKSISVKHGSVPNLEAGKLINVIEFK